MSKTETIEEKTYRLMGWVYGTQPPFKTIKQTNDFKLRCQMLELAIAEEREACVQKSALWALTKDMSSNLRLGLASAIRGRTYSADKGKQDRKGMT